jgi:hypothetical protein
MSRMPVGSYPLSSTGSFLGGEVADCKADHSCLLVLKMGKDVVWIVEDHGV